MPILESWWYLMYIVPGGTAVLLLIIFAMSGLGSTGESDIDIDTDAEIDLDTIEFDIDTNVDVDVDTSVDVDADTDVDSEISAGAEHHVSFMIKMLSVFGIGKVPLTITIFGFMILWGGIGYAINEFMNNLGLNPHYFWWIVAPGTFMLSTFALRGTSNFLAKILPSKKDAPKPLSYYVGSVGEVNYRISEHNGSARIVDNQGNGINVDCETRKGDPEIKEGKVLLYRYIKDRRIFIVVPYNK